MAAAHLPVYLDCLHPVFEIKSDSNFKRSAYTPVHLFWRRILNSIFKRHSTQTVTANTVIHQADGD